MGTTIPVAISDPINQKILSVSEDLLSGFQTDPFGEISRLTEIPVDIVIDRVKAMLASGTIRRVRQTMITTSLARGSLVAWQLEESKLNDAFDYMFQEDPFSGHVVIRTADVGSAGERYRLWTTLKVPPQFSLEKHADFLAEKVGAQSYRLMPAKKLFALGVGHTRRKQILPGSRSEDPGRVIDTEIIPLTSEQWKIMEVLKREFAVSELVQDLWQQRADEIGITLQELYDTADELEAKGLIGRFSTFLEHVKPTADGERVTRYNALFHWAVPEGMELQAGQELGRHHIMTHAYWREGGPEFQNVNVMGVVHGTDKQLILDHKKAIDNHLNELNIPVSYTNVFWGGRSEIKPSEISPLAYQQWCESNGIDLGDMTAGGNL
ncbi:MAG: AsnC family transcriptional regulator [Chloroflexi bacterium]|nr:AsnC family transcriptional regulator [Chloroflexota bacterium]